MSTLYLDCTHGARKDSFAAGVEALLPPEECERIVQAIRVADWSQVHEHGHAHGHDHDHEHDQNHDHAHSGHHHAHPYPHHHSMESVRERITATALTDAEKVAALGVYDVLAHAEAKAHGVSLSEVHFHEVGSDEAVTWVCTSAAAVVAVGADEIVASPVCTGFGFVECAHGTLPIPAPATANALEGVPTFAGEEEGELTTPTGAALVTYFANRFTTEPPASTQIAKVG